MPFAESDFILSVVGEEAGIFGIAVIMLLFFVLQKGTQNRKRGVKQVFMLSCSGHNGGDKRSGTNQYGGGMRSNTSDGITVAFYECGRKFACGILVRRGGA